MNGRQHLSGESRERRGFVPAHAMDRVVVLVVCIGSQFPRGRTGSPGCVPKFCDRVLPRKRTTVLDEGYGPVLTFAIAAGVDEPLVLAIRDLVPIDEVIAQRDVAGGRGDGSAGH